MMNVFAKQNNKKISEIRPTVKNGKTELVFILDRSGSMSGLESDTIGGFNSLLAKQKKEEGECFVSVVLFDNECDVIRDRVPIGEVPEMTADDYVVRGCTALIDAIGVAVKHVSDIHRYARPEDVPEHTMFVITTDGLENASRQFSSAEVKKMIEARKEIGWEFVFIGANIDAVETAKHFGIDRDRAVNYHADAQGTATVFAAVEKCVGGVRRSKGIARECLNEITEDYEARK